MSWDCRVAMGLAAMRTHYSVMLSASLAVCHSIAYTHVFGHVKVYFCHSDRRGVEEEIESPQRSGKSICDTSEPDRSG